MPALVVGPGHVQRDHGCALLVDRLPVNLGLRLLREGYGERAAVGGEIGGGLHHGGAGHGLAVGGVVGGQDGVQVVHDVAGCGGGEGRGRLLAAGGFPGDPGLARLGVLEGQGDGHGDLHTLVLVGGRGGGGTLHDGLAAHAEVDRLADGDVAELRADEGILGDVGEAGDVRHLQGQLVEGRLDAVVGQGDALGRRFLGEEAGGEEVGHGAGGNEGDDGQGDDHGQGTTASFAPLGLRRIHGAVGHGGGCQGQGRFGRDRGRGSRAARRGRGSLAGAGSALAGGRGRGRDATIAGRCGDGGSCGGVPGAVVARDCRGIAAHVS